MRRNENLNYISSQALVAIISSRTFFSKVVCLKIIPARAPPQSTHGSYRRRLVCNMLGTNYPWVYQLSTWGKRISLFRRRITQVRTLRTDSDPFLVFSNLSHISSV